MIAEMISATGNIPQGLRRGKSLLGREEDVHESGLALIKRGATLRRKRPAAVVPLPPLEKKPGGLLGDTPGPRDCWMYYCYILTCCIPPFLFSLFGAHASRQQKITEANNPA